MNSPTPAVLATTCPSCGARAVARQQWCLLCHASLRAPTVPAVAVRPAVEAPAAHPDAASRRAPRHAAAPTGVPGSHPSGAVPPARTDPPALDDQVVDGLLAALARDTAGGGPRLRTRSSRIAVAAGGAAALTAVLLLVMAVLGAVLG